MTISFQDKVVLVTGAATGIGRAAATVFSQYGAKVSLVGRQKERLEEAAKSIHNSHSIPADVSVEEDVTRAVEETINKFGRLDVVVANAGVFGVWAPIDELTAAEYDSVISSNLRSTFLTVKEAAPHLKKQGGAVVVVSDILGARSFSAAGASVYIASKAAQLALAKSLAVELGQSKVRVNVVIPGRTMDTQFEESREMRNVEAVVHPVKFPKGDMPLGEPAASTDVAQAIAFLASDLAAHITGTELFVDAGQSLVH